MEFGATECGPVEIKAGVAFFAASQARFRFFRVAPIQRFSEAHPSTGGLPSTPLPSA
jgi:hypothetical protein